MILQPLRLHSMGPGYERLNILFHHDLNTQDSKTRQARQQVQSNTQPRRRILTAPTLQRCLAACLTLLINLPCLLDFLCGLLEGAGNSVVGGSGALVFFAPDHLIQLTLCPRRDWFMVRIAEGNGELLQKFARAMYHCW